MTAATLSRLPITAGGALAGSLARGGYWTITRLVDFGLWTGAQFMRAPVAISTVAVIAGLSLVAGSNALYFQTSRHPAPLFFPPPRPAAPAPVVRPVFPAVRPHAEPPIDRQTTGSLGNAPTADTIDNADVKLLQQKLVALKLLDGTADGIFGRHTATALRAFETREGMKPRGMLTRELFAAVMAAPLSDDQPAAQPTATAVANVAAPSSAPIAPPPAPVRTATPATARLAPVPLAPLPPMPIAPTQAANSAPVARPAAAIANPLPLASRAPVAAAAAAEPPPAIVRAAVSMPPASVSGSAASSVAMNSLPAVAPTPPRADAAAAQKLAQQMGTLPPEATAASAMAPVATSSDPGADSGSTDPVLITKIQRGLASLGFLAQKIDGVPGAGTAKAIRNFEVFYDYKVTGLATPQLLNLLTQHGAET